MRELSLSLSRYSRLCFLTLTMPKILCLSLFGPQFPSAQVLNCPRNPCAAEAPGTLSRVSPCPGAPGLTRFLARTSVTLNGAPRSFTVWGVVGSFWLAGFSV